MTILYYLVMLWLCDNGIICTSRHPQVKFTNIINNIVSAMLQLLYVSKYATSPPRYE